jgi:hypothetical protein
VIAISLLTFIPSITHPAERRARLSALTATHGVVFFAWLLIFLIQSRLIATHSVATHRRLGFASIVILALMIPLAYTTTIVMVRRGYDLSGDLGIGTNHEVAFEAIFPLANLLIFTTHAIAALACRLRPEIHKRLVLFANIELMPAPLAHLIGHTPWLASLPGVIVMVPITALVAAAVGRDLLAARRIHSLTWGVVILRMGSGLLEAGPIGRSAAWHHFVYWHVR